ncbi:MAG: hypothetical protein AAGD25_35525 [Cyanobacteria bacterium P01_F01_bin.150]
MPNSSFNESHNNQFTLEQQVKEWLMPHESGKSRQLLLIRRYLRQFGLMDIISEVEVFNEAYIRVKKQVDAGKKIENLPAWFNKICFNIVREHKREQKRLQELVKKSSSAIDTTYEPASSFISELFSEEDFSRIKTIMNEMEISGDLDNKCIVEIIKLRFINDLKWKEVGDVLVLKGFYDKNDKALQERLRQKGSRLLKGLKKEFLAAASGGEYHA